jgi:hypothetical protein
MTSTRLAGVPPALPRAKRRTIAGSAPESSSAACTDCARARAMRRGVEGSSSPAGWEAKARTMYCAFGPWRWVKSRSMEDSAAGRSLSCTKNGSVRRSAPGGSASAPSPAGGAVAVGAAAGGAGVVSASRAGAAGGGGAAPGKASWGGIDACPAACAGACVVGGLPAGGGASVGVGLGFGALGAAAAGADGGAV